MTPLRSVTCWRSSSPSPQGPAHTAPRLHLGRWVRWHRGPCGFSFGWFNTEEETQAAIAAVRKRCRMIEKKALASYHLPHHLRGHGHGAAVSGGRLAGRLIPVPRTITADCGLAWRAELSLRPQLEALTQSMDVAGYYELELNTAPSGKAGMGRCFVCMPLSCRSWKGKGYSPNRIRLFPVPACVGNKNIV